MLMHVEYLWKDIQETDVISCLWEDRDKREIFLFFVLTFMHPQSPIYNFEVKRALKIKLLSFFHKIV